MNALIVGGSGGIGCALVAALCQREATASVTATYHSNKPGFTHVKLRWQPLDVLDEGAVKALLEDLPQLDYLLNAAGVLHCAEGSPEKTISRLDPHWFLRSMQINALPSLILAKYAKPLFKHSERPVFATVSARVGSIAENRLGGWYSYRSSKAALNMALKSLSIEWQRSLPRAVVAALHPGTTDTALSSPFQANVAAGKLFSPEQTANYLLKVVDGLQAQDSGRFWSWDGSELPW